MNTEEDKSLDLYEVPTGIDYRLIGDINQLKPKGKQNGGVSASEADVEFDVTEIMKRKQCFVSVGTKHGVQPALIAALASRESRAGRLLYKTDGWGDNSNAYGILQCDKNACPVCGEGDTCNSHPWDSCEHINMMTEKVLVPYIRQVQKKHPNWLPAQQIQGRSGRFVTRCRTWEGTSISSHYNDTIAAISKPTREICISGIAAYNFGVKNVQTWENLDKGTTGNDYSNDVIARAQYLMKKYEW